MTAAYESLRIEKTDGVAEVVLIGPGKGNAMGPDFWREMPQLLRELDADESVRVLLVRGEGANFCYGLDIASMLGTLGPLITGENNLAAERTKLLRLIQEMQGATEG